MSRTKILYGIIGCAFASLILFQSARILEAPTVRFSWATQECVEVEYPEGQRGACEDLPSLYNAVWVK